MAPRSRANRDNLGYLLAKASQRWNELLYEGFVREGFPEVRASYGSVLIPLFEEDGLRMGDIAARARISKQTMTTLVRLTERENLTVSTRDDRDARATRVHLTQRGQEFRPAVERVLADLDERVSDALGERHAGELARALKAVAELPQTAARAA